MKRIIMLGILLLVGISMADEIEQNDYAYFPCNNATDGPVLCSTANITCFNGSDTIFVNYSLTNVRTGMFKYQFVNTTNRLSCIIGCCDGAVKDYVVPVWIRTTPLITTDNIGINWADVANPTTALDLSATDIQLSDTCTAVTNAVVLPPATETQIDNIEADTEAVDTASELLTLLTTGNYPVATQTNVTIEIDGMNASIHAKIDEILSIQSRISFDVNSTNASVYSLFTEGSNEDAFKADVAGLPVISGGVNDTIDGIARISADVNTTNASVWDSPSRRLTYYPPTQAILTLDTSRSGLINSTHYYVDPSHIFAAQLPDNDQSMKTDYFLEMNFDIGQVPDNVTNVYLNYWAKKVGSPTGNLVITYDGREMNVTDVSLLTTSYAQYNVSIGGGNVTSPFVQIRFEGQAAWTQANDVIIGTGEVPGAHSYGSPDNTTWTHLVYELAIGLTIEYNQKATSDLLNADVHRVESDVIDAGCIGEHILTTIMIHSFKGEEMAFDSHLTSCVVERYNASNITDHKVSAATISYKDTSDSKEIYVMWNNTAATAAQGATYEIGCSTNWTIGGTEYDFAIDRYFTFSRECDIQTNISTLYDNITNAVVSVGVKIDDMNRSIRDKVDDANASITNTLGGLDTISADLNTTAGNIDILIDDLVRISADVNATNASVYSLFTQGSNEDEFKSDVAGLAVISEDVNDTIDSLITVSTGVNDTPVNVDIQINASHGPGNYSGFSAADILAIAAGVWAHNISASLPANNTLYANYEILVLSGFGSFSVEVPGEADLDEPVRVHITKYILVEIVVPKEIWRCL